MGQSSNDSTSPSAASGVNALPISGGDSNGNVTIEGRPFAAGEAPTASFRRILPDYFQTVGTPVLYGRDFLDSDRGEPMVSSLVSEPNKTLFVDWSPYLGHVWTMPAETGMDIKALQSIAHDSNVPPDNLYPSPPSRRLAN